MNERLFPALPAAPPGVWTVGLLLLLLLLIYVATRVLRVRPSLDFVPWFHVARVGAGALAIALVFDLLAFSRFGGAPFLGVLALVLVLLGPYLLNVFAGLAFLLEGRIHLGARIRIGEIEDKVSAVRLRALIVESADGSLHVVPFRRLVDERITFPGGATRGVRCEVSVVMKTRRDAEQLVEIGRKAALLSALGSPAHTPEVYLESAADGELVLRIVGWAIDDPHVEAYRTEITKRVLAAELPPKTSLG